jgi:LDH2 family malate/lactate/ureidoglycolate dehydrogenase
MYDVKIDSRVLENFVSDLLCTSGIDDQEAKIISKVMVWTEMIGRSEHGLKRLPLFVKRFKQNLINSPCKADFVHKSESVSLLQGNDGAGQVLGHLAMMKAIEMADIGGVGLVAVQNSNHFGANSYYNQMAAKANKISIVTTNSFPIVAPHGGMSPVFGTNPFAFGAPVRSGQTILVDFSTSGISGAMIRKFAAEKKTIPLGVALDEDGNDTTDPVRASKGSILPVGGAKGYCLGLMIEILSGVITGSAISNEIGSVWKDFTRRNRVGHLFLTIDVSRLMPLERYYDRIEDLVSFIKEAKKRVGINEILLPGETRWRNYQDSLNNGVRIGGELFKELQSLADELKIMVPWEKKNI